MASLLVSSSAWSQDDECGGDLLLLTSLFVLGGDFWDKLRALFFHQAKAVFPQTTS